MTPKQLRNAFWAKKAEVDAAQATVNGMREKYDAAVQKAEASLRPMIKHIRELEAPLFDMKQELATYVRALGGNTAPQPGDKD